MPRLSQTQVEMAERDLYAYRKSRFVRAACVDLSHISFDPTFSRQMDDGENIRRLEKIMEIQGFLRLRQENHVPVIVSAFDWEHRMRLRDQGESLPWLEVDENYRLQAEDHQNLIDVAHRKLGPGNQWWVIDIYVTGSGDSDEGRANVGVLHSEFVRSLQESHRNDRRPPDGLIYQKIRYYQGFLSGPQNKIAENQWWAALENVPRAKKRGYLRAFFRHPGFTQAFDTLLPIEGIWADMSIGVLHKLKAIRCDEPILCYLQLIRQTFHDVIGGSDLLPQVDTITVRFLTSRAPKVSEQDLKFLDCQMKKGVLFRKIQDPQQRNDIWERLKNIEYPIPTLKTFFKDIHYLEVGQSVMQYLFVPDLEHKVTIDIGVGGQYDTTVSMSIPYRQHMIRRELYDLWRFSLQYGFEMTDHQHRVPHKKVEIQDEPRLSRQSTPLDRSALWQHFYWLARRHRFSVPFTDDTQSEPANLPYQAPYDYPEGGEVDLALSRQYGKPFTDSTDADRFALSQESLGQPWEIRRVTAGFVRRSVFRAFFRYLSSGSPDSPPLAPSDDFPGPGNVPSEVPLEEMDIQPDETIPHTTFTHGDNADSAGPATSIHQVDPTSVSQTDNEMPMYFAMRLFLPSQPRQDLTLPNSHPVLNQFFKGLEDHNFHISNPNDPNEYGRGYPWEDCYQWYVEHPSSVLDATFIGVSCERYGLPTDNSRNKRKRTDEDLDNARRWLRENWLRWGILVNNSWDLGQ